MKADEKKVRWFVYGAVCFMVAMAIVYLIKAIVLWQ